MSTVDRLVRSLHEDRREEWNRIVNLSVVLYPEDKRLVERSRHASCAHLRHSHQDTHWLPGSLTSLPVKKLRWSIVVLVIDARGTRRAVTFPPRRDYLSTDSNVVAAEHRQVLLIVARVMNVESFPSPAFSSHICKCGDSSYQPSVRSPRQGEVIYFLLPDRFNNGDSADTRGARSLHHRISMNLDPSNAHFFHGGDLSGS